MCTSKAILTEENKIFPTNPFNNMTNKNRQNQFVIFKNLFQYGAVKFLFFHQKLRSFRDLGFGPCVNRRNNFFVRSYFNWAHHKLTKNRRVPPLGCKQIFLNIGFIVFNRLGHTVSTNQMIN
jgi:hypothetical protein